MCVCVSVRVCVCDSAEIKAFEVDFLSSTKIRHFFLRIRKSEEESKRFFLISELKIFIKDEKIVS